MKNLDRRPVLCGIAMVLLAMVSRSPASRGFPTQKVPHPIGVLTRLPADDNRLALTIDDGASVQVVGAFADFCRDSGTRVTFFVNGANSSWSVNAPALRPMVDSGQIQMGNHTWSHADITRIDPAAVADQIRRNADFLRNSYGVDGTPYFRPPYGRHTPATDRIAADQGYATITLWSGSFGDDVPISDAGLIAGAERSLRPQQIVLGHANLPTITHCFPQLLDIMHSRNLQTVTLNDVFARNAQAAGCDDTGGVTTGPDSGGTVTTVKNKGLKCGALGLPSGVVVGLASMAPAYSLAATLGLIVASGGGQLSGVKAPAVVLISFIPMYFIAVAYQELNKAEPDCGTTFTWASRAFGPIVGWLGGWGIIAAEVIVMANLVEIAGAYSFRFVGELGWRSVADLAYSRFWSTLAGVFWIVVMTYVCYRGIEVSARLLYLLLSVQIVVLIVFSVVALVKVYTLGAHAFSLHLSLSWFWPGGLDFGKVVAPAVLMAIFMYWGWDTAVACNEESDDPSRTPGRAAILSTFLLLATYTLVTVSAVAFAGVGTKGIGLGNPHNSKDVFASIGPELFGNGVRGEIALLLLAASILTSATASTQTTILQTARTTLSMATYKALPDSFAKTHRRYLTPTTSTIAVGVVSVFFYVLFTLISENLLAALIGSVGLMIAFYYGLTGFACAWTYRNSLTRSLRDFAMRGLVPLLGGVGLLIVLIYALIQYAKPAWLTDDEGHNITILGFGAVAAVGIGALVLGLILMVIWWAVAPGFFRGHTMTRSPTRADSSGDVVQPAGP